MKLVKEHSRLTQIKEGNKIIFKVLQSKSGKNFHSMYKGGWGIVSYCNSFEECIERTFEKLHIINEDFKNRLITL
jgi:hypothetical protein|tara:strand:+ start:3611 stop:3835 length:225 start_codon:yes stop_codon:yes gene_type:complete